MKRILPFALALALASCSSGDKSRQLSSFDRDLSGTYLGVSAYKFGHKGPNKAATRIYLAEIDSEPGSYNAVLLEYVNLLKMAPQYIAANKLPIASKAIGYLKNITSKISTYKVVPSKVEGTYEMYPLKIAGDQIVPNKAAKPRLLVLSKEKDLKNPLEGAVITSVADGQPKEIFFPTKDDEKTNGFQYGLAKFTYNKIKLDSTWRKNYLPGPFLSAYGRLDDVVLSMKIDGNDNNAKFQTIKKYTGLSAKKRKGMFTNPKSAFLDGDYSVSEPRDGMFLFHSVKSDKKTQAEVTGRIGLFIDIFDATKALNQDVVEFALIDPNNDADFLMYYEHPDNGEGR